MVADSRQRLPPRPTPNLGSRLRAFRTAAQLTQEELARRSRTTAKYISEIENNHTNPSLDVLTRLVERGLGVTMSAFFGEDTPGEIRDDLERLRALFAAQPAIMRRRALRVLKALCEG